MSPLHTISRFDLWVYRTLVLAGVIVFLWAVWPVLHLHGQSVPLSQINATRIQELASRLNALEQSQHQLAIISTQMAQFRDDLSEVQTDQDRIMWGIVGSLGGLVANLILTWRTKTK